MSAAAVWGVPVAPSSPVSSRSRLALVVSNDRPGRSPGRLRITRRGRLVVTIACALLAAALTALATSAAARVDLRATTDHVVVVPAGSTLSQIAARELPDRSVAQGVADIRRLNGLTTDQVSAGQVLGVPGR